jgi:hypothetical protein
MKPHAVALLPTWTRRLWCVRFHGRAWCFVVGPFGHVAFARRVNSERIPSGVGTPRCLDAYLSCTAWPICAAWPVRSRTIGPRLHCFTFQHRCSFTRCCSLQGPPWSLPWCAGQLFWLVVEMVVAMIASVRRTHCFNPSHILSWGSKPVSRVRPHSRLVISLPTWSTDERWRLTPLDSLGVSSFGCSGVRIPSNANSMNYFWNGGLEISIACVIVAGSIVDIPLLANGPTM